MSQNLSFQNEAHTCSPSCTDCKQINCNKSLTKTEWRWITDHLFAALPINYDDGRYSSSAWGMRKGSTLQSLASVKRAPPLSEKFDTALGSTAHNKAWTRLSALIYMQAESDLPRVCLAWLSRASETLTCLQRAFPRSTEEKLASIGSLQQHYIMDTPVSTQQLLNMMLTRPHSFHMASACKQQNRDERTLTTPAFSGEYDWGVRSLKPAISERASSATKAAVS